MRPFSTVPARCFCALLLTLAPLVSLTAAGCRTSSGTVSRGSGTAAAPNVPAGAGGRNAGSDTGRLGFAGSSSAATGNAGPVAQGNGGTNGAGARSGRAGAGGASPSHTGAWRITPLGDSITSSTCGPQLLSKALIERGKTNFTFVGGNLNNQSCNGAPAVQTEGHGGYLVTDLVGSGVHAAELPTWSKNNKAELVLMQFGTNDVWNDRAPSVILAAYSTVLSHLRAANPNVIVLVAQITPLNPAGCSACESRVTTLNAQIPGWAARSSTPASRVSVVDLHSAFTGANYTANSSYTADGVHPNVAGAQLIANEWYDALVALGVP